MFNANNISKVQDLISKLNHSKQQSTIIAKIIDQCDADRILKETVDCGITRFETGGYAGSLVFDHHKCGYDFLLTLQMFAENQIATLKNEIESYGVSLEEATE